MSSIESRSDDLFIQPAVPDDLPAVMTLVEACIATMESQGIFQWNEHYPTAEIFTNDIQRNTSFAAKRNHDLLGIIVLDENQAPEYRGLTWNSGEHALVVHRLAVHPDWQSRGIGRALMDFTEKLAREQGYESIRFDAYNGNPRALAFYDRLGYRKVGEVRFPFRELAFSCFEKAIT